jgi:ABC-2 type transport system ATP-binding protein
MVQLTDLSFSYRGRPPLFKGLELSLTAGNIYGLLGRNGAGKTTLLKIVSGLLFARRGSSSVMGYDARWRSPDFLQELFLVPEELHVPSVTAAAYARRFGPFYPRFSVESYESLLSEFGIDTSDRLSTLSYGDKKKAVIAFGLATGCRLLLLDEPTNGLDIPGKSQFRRLIAGALTDERVFVISTHQVRDMESLIDPIVILEGGRIVFHRTTAEVSARLAVATVDDPRDAPEALYCEKGLDGYTVVTPNTDGAETRIDLELLFKAVTTESQKVEAVFAEGGNR